MEPTRAYILHVPTATQLSSNSPLPEPTRVPLAGQKWRRNQEAFRITAAYTRRFYWPAWHSSVFQLKATAWLLLAA